MLVHEVTKPPTPQQQRVKQLKTQLDAARRAARVARLNKQQQHVNQQRAELNRAR
jgi:hypothetical protein